MNRPVAGDLAPEISLPDATGALVNLSDFRGRKVVVYFYPKDDTSGCTQQACELRDNIETFDARGVVVLGISPDGVTSHQKFRDKFALPFPLLADVGHSVCEAYGVWGEKSMYGRKYMGVERTTFVIDEEGVITKVLPKVKPAEHVDLVLSAL